MQEDTGSAMILMANGVEIGVCTIGLARLRLQHRNCWRLYTLQLDHRSKNLAESWSLKNLVAVYTVTFMCLLRAPFRPEARRTQSKAEPKVLPLRTPEETRHKQTCRDANVL